MRGFEDLKHMSELAGCAANLQSWLDSNVPYEYHRTQAQADRAEVMTISFGATQYTSSISLGNHVIWDSENDGDLDLNELKQAIIDYAENVAVLYQYISDLTYGDADIDDIVG